MMRKSVLPWLVPIFILIVWQLFSSSHVLSEGLFPSPLSVLKALWELITNGALSLHLQISLARALSGLLIGGLIGFVLGIINGWSALSFRLLDTTIQMIRNIPHFALLPLVIVWLGIGEAPKVFLVALGVMFPVYINTLHGIRNVNREHIEMGKMYGLRGFQLFKQIYFPSALPSIFVGFRYALGVMWLTLIVSETIATSNGIGYLAMNARQFMQTDVIIVSILVYALLGKAADIIAHIGERYALKWHPNYQKQG
ncbi:ABC transporter permease subunit [Bacillus siamensis]|uniref:ABC transporter permease subunit n=1 Tax=Bacillus siamensis TaxID=659243 RepID=UPI003F66E8C0